MPIHTHEIDQEAAEREAKICQEQAEREGREGKRLADDLLRGAKQIGDYLGMTEDEVYHAHRMRKIPAGKWGKEIISFKSKLDRAMRALVS